MRLFLACFLFFAVSLFSDQKSHAPSVQEYYAKVTKAFQDKNWLILQHYCQLLISKYAGSSFAQDAHYYMGVSYFDLKDYQMADHHLSKYLSGQISPVFFEESLKLKFEIAELFRQGAKRHVFGVEQMPRWMNGRMEALKIYDEITHSLPHSDLAARSLFSKAEIQAKHLDYRESVDTLNLLIRRFPKHELAIESFLEIGKNYFKQCHPKHQDPDLLDLAMVNLRKFQEAFPQEERVEEAVKIVNKMKEIYAEGLLEIGKFYERTKKNGASIIYYSKIVSNFPGTKAAKFSESRLALLKKA